MKFEIEKNYRFGDNNLPFIFWKGDKKYGPWTASPSLGKYLHSNGKIRNSCLDVSTGLYTGWYNTREAARKAVRDYKANQT